MSFALLIPLVLYVFYYRVSRCQTIAVTEMRSCKSISVCTLPASFLRNIAQHHDGMPRVLRHRARHLCRDALYMRRSFNTRPLHMQVYVQKELTQLAKSKKENAVEGASHLGSSVQD